jgi:hypothetical protein
MKTLKSVTIEGIFTDLEPKDMFQTGRGAGCNVRAAAANAMRDLLKQPKLKAKRFSVCKATISSETVGAEQNAKNVNLANQMTTVQAEHARASPLKFMNGNSAEKKKRNTVRL